MREKIKARILSVLLTEKQPLSKYKVAKLTGASFGWTHEFLAKLEQQGLVRKTKVVSPPTRRKPVMSREATCWAFRGGGG